MSVKITRTKEQPDLATTRNLCILLLFFLSALTSTGQEKKNYEKIVIGDARFILHTVQKSETLYSISRQYDCTQEEVLASNNINGVIKKGMVLRIPDHSYQKPQAARVDDSKFLQHQVVSGDNYYQLKLKYGVDEEELLKYNPELKDGLKTGRIILVPRKSQAETSAREDQAVDLPVKEQAIPVKPQGKAKTFNIGLYLPISAAVSDSLKPTARSLSFLAFYQGALMAVEQAEKSGIKAKLFVYDTEKENSRIESLVKKPEFLSFDLLIGPVYPEIQRLVSDLSAKNRIAMVSPLSPDDRFSKTNSSYFQVNPVRKMRIETTGDYLFKEYSKEKIIFLETESGSSDTRLIHERLTKKYGSKGPAKGQFITCNIWSKGIDGLEPLLQTDKPNILVMAEMNEVNVSIAMNRLTLLSKKYPLVLVGIQEFTRMQSIETENLHEVNLRFLTTSFVDYNLPKVITFVENFKTEYATEPSIFAFQGYDITTCFLQALQKSGSLSRGIPSESNSGVLHTSYHFSKISELGGYTNDNFTVVEYANSFETKSGGTIRHMD